MPTSPPPDLPVTGGPDPLYLSLAAVVLLAAGAAFVRLGRHHRRRHRIR